MSDALVSIQVEPFSVEEVVSMVKKASNGIGAVVTFPGMAEKKLNDIRERALANFDIIEMAIVHRTGKIAINEDIVLIAAASAHRNDSFMACEWAITELKRITPIWKRETPGKGEVWGSQTPQERGVLAV